MKAEKEFKNQERPQKNPENDLPGLAMEAFAAIMGPNRGES